LLPDGWQIWTGTTAAAALVLLRFGHASTT
jgi:hypothetical protein